jgi:lipoprotein-anchoring transpeptidase ErfK/SrfK
MAACSALLICAGPVAAAVDTATSPCPHRIGRVVCVDQNRQRMWVQQGSKIIFGPVLVRTGYRGMWTPDGWFRIYERHEWPSSQLLPYTQFFYRRYALHGSRDDLHKGISHGCVNMSVQDARHLWGMLTYGDHVYIWGHKPGT